MPFLWITDSIILNIASSLLGSQKIASRSDCAIEIPINKHINNYYYFNLVDTNGRKNEKFIEREGDGGKLREKLIKSDRGSGAQIESARNRRRKSLIEIARTGLYNSASKVPSTGHHTLAVIRM